MDTLFKFVVCVLAVYGLLSLAASIFSLFPVRIKNNRGKIKVVLAVKDSEEVIEGVIRNIILTMDTLREFSADGKITVVDVGSRDGTLEILNKLKDTYECIEVLNYDEKEKVFSSFD